MRSSFDFSPLSRSSIGFEHLFSLLDDASRLVPSTAGVNYNIERLGNDAYRITLAVPGFEMEDLEILQQPNLLIVNGKTAANDKSNYLHRSIEQRSFSQRFELADFVEVGNASLRNGLLCIELRREVPEAMKPRRIQIANGTEAEPQKQIESKAA
jgi:molecular chaperone IbpA